MMEWQLLAFRVEVGVEDDRLVPVLGYLANRAGQPVAPSAAMRFDIDGFGPYELIEEGQHVATLPRPDDVLFVLTRRCHTRLLDHLAGWAAVHGGVVSVGDRRALVIGPKGAGKTTLLLRLLFDGHAVEGDEAVFVKDRDAMCLPRNFHVKAGAPALVPELAERWDDWPRTSTSDGMTITAFNPIAAGFGWQLEQGPIDVAFVLRANHQGTSSCRPLSSLDLVAAAVANGLPTGVATGVVVQAFSSLLGQVSGHELRVGDLAGAADLLVATAID